MNSTDSNADSVGMWDSKPASFPGLNDTQIELCRRLVSGGRITRAEYDTLGDVPGFIAIGDAKGFAVIGIEDFAKARRELSAAMAMVETLGASEALTELSVKLEGIQRILSAWNPPGR